MFDVVYEDGTQRSNRKVPRALLGGIDGDKPAHGFLIEQDREIAEKSGRPPAGDPEHLPLGREEEGEGLRLAFFPSSPRKRGPIVPASAIDLRGRGYGFPLSRE